MKVRFSVRWERSGQSHDGRRRGGTRESVSFPCGRPVLSFLLFFALAATAALAAEPVGRIEYVEGEVKLLRDGSTYDTWDLGPGDPLYVMDVIQTGSDGFVEVILTATGRSTVRVRENTAYYVETESRTGGGTRARLRVLTGSVETAVNQLTAGSTLDVETRSATFGVRGTEFDVLTAPDESSLLGVRSGRVEITGGGRQARAEAGVAVEVQPDGVPEGYQVPDGDFDRFYEQWVNIRLQAFRSGAATFIQAYARRFNDTDPTFQSAYTELMRHRDRLRAASEADTTSRGEDMRLRTDVSPAMIRMRSILPLYEDTVYRLRELHRFHREGIGTTTIDGRSSTDFFREFAEREGRLLSRLSEVRTVFRMYSVIEQRSFGGLPGGGSLFDGGSPLNNSRDF